MIPSRDDPLIASKFFTTSTFFPPPLCLWLLLMIASKFLATSTPFPPTSSSLPTLNDRFQIPRHLYTPFQPPSSSLPTLNDRFQIPSHLYPLPTSLFVSTYS
ncbi:hypothetical protein GW17_00026141 [Ensete ventricosum]|nr:hypothetical protein GW17_00026141 [Ensete ventricosum]